MLDSPDRAYGQQVAYVTSRKSLQYSSPWARQSFEVERQPKGTVSLETQLVCDRQKMFGCQPTGL